MEENDNWKAKTLIIGAIFGALTGLVAAYVLIQKAEQEETHPKITAGDGVKVGLGLLGVMRLLTDSSTKK
jgi:hypothetical protein